MTPQEMHIGIDLIIQKINSNINKDILPEEKDWLLNDEVDKYIKARKTDNSNIKKTGFQDTTKRLEDLKDLICKETLSVITENGKSYIDLPDNYYDYVRADSYLIKSCNAENLETNTNSYKKLIINTNLSTLENNYSIDIVVDGQTVNLFNLDDLPNNYVNITNSSMENFIVLKAIKILVERKIKELYNSSDISLYWEYYSNEYYSNSFIIITNLNITSGSVTLGSDVTTTNATDLEVSSYSIEDMLLKGHIRILDEEFENLARMNTLAKTRPQSMIGSIEKNRLEILVPDSVVLGFIELVYICKPSIIDLHLNNSLNMSRKVCKEIVNNTSRYILALIEANNYEAVVRENLLIE